MATGNGNQSASKLRVSLERRGHRQEYPADHPNKKAFSVCSRRVERVKPVPLLLKDIYTRLLERGHKMTPQRWAIISIFLINKGRHLSADDVYGMLKETYPNNGIATVYRTLELLEEITVLRKMDFGDGRARYEVADEESHHHHHLVCTECGKITEFEDDLLDSLEQAIERKTGFKIRDHVAKFYGVCGECQTGRK